MLKNKFVRIGQALAVGSSILSIHSWIEGINNKKELTTKISEIKEKIDNIDKTVNQHTIDDSVKNKLVTEIKPLKDSLNEMNILHEKLETLITDQEVNSDSNLEVENKVLSQIEASSQEIGALIQKSTSKIAEIEKFLIENGWSNRLTGDNVLYNLIKEYKEFLSTLSVYQLCMIINLSLSIFILTCLISILFAFYGNFFINKLSLETKYPKLSGIIRLRMKFQHYYIITNSLLIIIALFVMGYVNICTFLYG